jgi:hypothetical protein
MTAGSPGGRLTDITCARDKSHTEVGDAPPRRLTPDGFS